MRFVTVEQIRSGLRRDGRQLLYLQSLGLGRIGKTKRLKETPEVLGLLRRAAHLIKIVRVDYEAQ